MPAELIFDIGSVKNISSQNIKLGKKPLIVTGKKSSKINGALASLLTYYSNAVVFDNVEENPSIDTCEKAREYCIAKNCDWIIAVGGGSPIDVGKAVAGLATNEGPCEQYFGRDLFKQSPLPILAIPTTAGTGSEVTPYAVITNEKNVTKQTIADKRLFPKIALLDPSLTLTLSRDVTLSTALDALSQSLEGIVSKKATPISDCIAIESCKKIIEWLPVALREPDNITARYWLLFASLLSGIVIAQTGTTLVHALGYYYTLNYNVPHGIANALFLIPMFKRNIIFFPEKLRFVIEFLGEEYCKEHPEISIKKALLRFFKDINFSCKSSSWGVPDNQLQIFSEQLYSDSYRFRNQHGAFSKKEIYNIFKETFEP